MKRKKTTIAIFVTVVIVAGIIAGVSLFLNKQTYTVSFYNDNKTLIKSEAVQKNHAVAPPNNPQLTYGKVFKRWDKSFSKVKKDIEVYPEFEDVAGKKNVFALASAYSDGETYAFVPLTLSGEVCVSGFQLTLTYDAEIVHLESVFNEDGALINNIEQPGKVFMNYVSAENTIGDVDLCTLKFKISGNAEEAPLSLTVDKIYAFGEGDDLYSPEFTVSEASVFAF